MNDTVLGPTRVPEDTSGTGLQLVGRPRSKGRPAGRRAPRNAARQRAGWAVLLLTLACGLLAERVSAMTFEELVNDPHLTPERLVAQFADFKFRLSERVQKPEEFLARKAGDCDDFATLAAEVLRRKGYRTRLIVVHLAQDTHVVCYVSEIKGYLDYNCRHQPHPVVASDGSLTDVGQKVAASFRSAWRSASEFTYEAGQPKYLLTAFR